MPRHRREPSSPGMTSHDAPFRRQVQRNLARAGAVRDLRRHRRIDLPSRLLSHQPLCLSQQNGIPPTTSLVTCIVSDNGTEFTSKAILKWANENGVEWHYIDPGADSDGSRPGIPI